MHSIVAMIGQVIAMVFTPPLAFGLGYVLSRGLKRKAESMAAKYDKPRRAKYDGLRT